MSSEGTGPPTAGAGRHAAPTTDTGRHAAPGADPESEAVLGSDPESEAVPSTTRGAEVPRAEDTGPPGATPNGQVLGPITDQNQSELRRRRHAAHRSTLRRRRRLVLALLGTAIVLVAAVVGWYEIEANPSGGPGAGVTVSIRAGESSTAVIDQLGQRGVISSPLAFRVGDLVQGSPSIRPGPYLFHKNQSFSTVRAILAGGPNIAALTVAPGYTLREVAAQLGAVSDDLSRHLVTVAQSGVVRSPYEPEGSTNLEGLLGTGTYRILPGTTDVQLLETMVTRFDQQAAAAGATPAAAVSLGITPYQLVIVASIVEKEGYVPESNLGPVARVIYNRLAAGMHLDMDSTVLYALGQDGGPVTAADLKLDSPYNTYLYGGLTPTPVCFPSPAALHAAAHPPAGSWLYFVVVDKNGTEAFSDTFAQQEANEALAKSRGLG